MKKMILVLILIAALGSAFASSEKQEETQKTWEWTLDQIKAAVAKVRAGKDLTPKAWPNAARVAVALSFDFDAETNALRDQNLSPGIFSQGEYASRTAVPRILDLLDKYDIPASFFVPAVSALLHPEQVETIVSKGRHELGLHGWIHERNSVLTEEEERLLMKKSYDVLKEMTGTAPKGIRTPSWDFSQATLKLIHELGLLYDSSLMADDRPYEILQNGEPTGIVELPVEWLLDDYPYFGFDRYSSVRPHIKPMDVLEIWTSEFDQAYEEGTLFLLTMHPKYIGHRSRIVILEKLIQHIRERQDVWFATHADIAKYAKKSLVE